jgi:glycosyltransferase involved in cell wall biosynthesis
MFLASASILLTIAYTALLLAYLRGWQALPEWQIPDDFVPKTKVSVVVAARNEAANIEACLRSVLEGSYPANLLEIIVVDDFSEDETCEIVARNFPAVHLLHLRDLLPPAFQFSANKKKAIEIGIAHATGEFIATTDADCLAPKDWLRFLASVCEVREVKIVCAPVAFHREQNLFQRFQSLDFLGLMGITGAGIQLSWQRMGNGANLAYPKAVFEGVGGFSNNEDKASGDDMFLIQKVAAQWPHSIFFLKNPAATVLTEAKSDLVSFFQQRLRWGTKNAALPEWPVRLSLLAVFLFCWSIWLNMLLKNGSLIVFQLLVKAVFDFILLREMCRFFKREDLLRWFAPSFFLHTLYIPLVGAASLFLKKYEWKGRRVN